MALPHLLKLKTLQIAAKTATSVAARSIAEKQLKDYVADVAIKTGTRQAIGVGAVQQGADIGTGSYEDIYSKLISQKRSRRPSGREGFRAC